jgi:actin-related protein
MAETLFEEMKVIFLYIIGLICSVYEFSHIKSAFDRRNNVYLNLNLSGLVIESGEGITSVVPIYESYPIYHAI